MRSVATFRRTQKLAIARAAYQTYLDSQKVGEAKVGDAPALETVIRTPFDNSIDPQEIAFDLAKWEMSKWATVHNTTGTDFEKYEGKQVDYLIEIDGLFFEPTKKGATAELLNAGIVIKTRLAKYKAVAKEVETETVATPTPKSVMSLVEVNVRRVSTKISQEVEWYFQHGNYPERIIIQNGSTFVIDNMSWKFRNPNKPEVLPSYKEMQAEEISNPCEECGGETESKDTGYEKDICGACQNE